jgi:hypothetical protein
MSTKEFLLAFIKRMGKTGEIALFLKTFQGVPRHKFAVIFIHQELLTHHLPMVADNIAWMNKLEIYPIVVLDTDTAEGFHRHSKTLVMAIEAKQGKVSILNDGWTWEKNKKPRLDVEKLTERLSQSQTPIISPHGIKNGKPFLMEADLLAQMIVSRIKPQKYIHLTEDGGILEDQTQTIIPFMNVSQNKAWTSLVRPEDKPKIREIQKIIKSVPGTAIIITSAEHLLREIFTTKGHGTFIKDHHLKMTSKLQEINKRKVKRLLEDAFQKQLSSTYFEHNFKTFFYEKDYEGIAIVQDLEGVPYLDKFAVAKIAEGTGLGKSLWQKMNRKYAELIWRATPQNPMNSFYLRECDGCFKTEKWNVFWTGISPQKALELLPFVLEKPLTLYTENE